MHQGAVKSAKKEIKATMIVLPILTFLFGVIMSFLYVLSSPYIQSTFLLMSVFIFPILLSLLGLRSSVKKLFKQINDL